MRCSARGNGRVAYAPVTATRGSGTTLATTSASFPAAIAVDSYYVYWTNLAGSTGVQAVPNPGGPLAGGPDGTVVVALATNVTGGQTIAVDQSSVYFTVSGNGTAGSGGVYKVAK